MTSAAREILSQLSATATDLQRIAEAFAYLEAERSGRPEASPPLAVATPPPAEASWIVAKRLFASRRRRERFFDSALFHDAAWDLLLDLYIAGAQGRNICVSNSCHAGGVPPSTMLRSLEHLTAIGLVERHADPHDGHRVLVTLTDRSRTAMRDYLEAELASS